MKGKDMQKYDIVADGDLVVRLSGRAEQWEVKGVTYYD